MEVRKNDIINGKIVDLNDDGQGVLKTSQSEVVFVPNTLIGEQVSALVINTKSKFSIGKSIEILNKSKDRCTPPCPYYTKCGGCDLMHMSTVSQINFKTQKVKHLFKKIANIDIDVKPCINLNQLRYRNKIALPVNESGEIGLFRKNSHNILPITDCLITKEFNKKLIECLQNYIQKSGISIYNEKTKSGILKHVVAREIHDVILITLVVTKTEIPKQKLLIEILKSNFNKFGLNLNINTLDNNVILGQKWIHLFGEKELYSDEYGIIYPVSNASFFQVNDQIKKAIYDKVLTYINGNSVVIDAYSGAGLLSGIISKKAKKCYGVEIVKEATINANTLKEKNNLSNLENINGDCGEIIPNLINSLKNEELIVTLDPPRSGCDKKVLKSIINSAPSKILYISCDPGTLARDTKIIIDSNKYSIQEVQPYDMFPQTKHVETFISFVKK